jgi:hypothetical protein
MSQRRRREKRDERREMRDEKRETRDERQETRDERRVSERIKVRAIIFLNRLAKMKNPRTSQERVV